MHVLEDRKPCDGLHSMDTSTRTSSRFRATSSSGALDLGAERIVLDLFADIGAARAKKFARKWSATPATTTSRWPSGVHPCVHSRRNICFACAGISLREHIGFWVFFHQRHWPSQWHGYGSNWRAHWQRDLGCTGRNRWKLSSRSR